MLNILLSGVGGQGTVLASKLIAKAAMEDNKPVHTAETIGMAQRGGCVVSHVRIGENCHSPLIPFGCADVIISFEPSEAVRVMPYLKKGGTVIVSSGPVKPVTDALSKTDYNADEMLDYLKNQDIRLIIVDSNKVIEESSSKSLNIALLGAAAGAGVIEIEPQKLRKIITDTLPEKFAPANIRALEVGLASVN